MCHEDLCKKVGARADFFQWLAEAMVSSRKNWNDYATAENNSYDTQENTTYKETSHVKQVTGAPVVSLLALSSSSPLVLPSLHIHSFHFILPSLLCPSLSLFLS
ncbi:MAG: hypothetical protein ACK53Y_24195, partial [bacterium]